MFGFPLSEDEVQAHLVPMLLLLGSRAAWGMGWSKAVGLLVN